jgi:hypothetical protein
MEAFPSAIFHLPSEILRFHLRTRAKAVFLATPQRRNNHYMGSLKKRRKSKIAKHKRKKRMKENRHKKRLRYKS